jgi:hypothetical protein
LYKLGRFQVQRLFSSAPDDPTRRKNRRQAIHRFALHERWRHAGLAENLLICRVLYIITIIER